MIQRNKKMYILIPVLLMILFMGSFGFILKEEKAMDNEEISSSEEVQVIELEPESDSISEKNTDITESEYEASNDVKVDTNDSDFDGLEDAANDVAEGNSDEKETTVADLNEDDSGDWVATLPAAQNEKQIMVVAATGSSAVLSLHNKDADGNWKEMFSTKASIGKNGIGKSKEGDHKTPRGSYRFTRGFGIKRPDSVNLPYTQVDGNCFWVDDPASKYYNQFVNLGSVEKDWNSAESLAGSGKSYNYALAINYNEACVPGKGSAIFLHCLPTGGAGCIAVSEDAMVRILKETGPDCLLLIESAAELGLN